jgi:FkbH-like protein
VSTGPATTALQAALASHDAAAALTRLRQIAGSGLDYAGERDLVPHAEAIEALGAGLEPLKLALLATGTVDHILPVLKARLVVAGYRPTIFTPSFDTVVQTIHDPASDLYGFQPDVVWIMTSGHDIDLSVAAGADPAAADAAVAAAVAETLSHAETVKARAGALVIVNNADDPLERGLGQIDAAAPWGRLSLLRRYNQELARALPAGALVFDLAGVAAEFGLKAWHDRRFWFHSKHQFAFDAYGRVAHLFARLVVGARGRSAKCLVLDLDNTLWGGVIGDAGVEGIELGDGPDGEAFMAFQAFAKRLSQRGVLLAVCSKNEMEAAQAPFLNHPDMQLKLGDIVSFKANWRNKAENITAIAQELNIRRDALVFVDDNPVERDLVRSLAPDVWVPEMPEDPAEYVDALDAMRYFEAVSFSSEDAQRTALYVENKKRDDFRSGFEDLDGYLKSLAMQAIVAPMTGLGFKRAVQLVNKSNQFNLTGARLAEGDAEARLARPETAAMTFRLMDRFGDNGLISVVIGEAEAGVFTIDTWVMSCRVLARGMEDFILAEILRRAEALGCREVIGVYRDSGRNGLVKGLYERLGFSPAGGAEGETRWRLTLPAAEPQHHIERLAEAG